MPAAIIIGFYRYSDILFEWHQVIADPAEKSALKAFLSNSALGDPRNPLRREGDKGLDLYLGTLPTGQLRLLFSSAQVEYIRYWLHAMGLTKNLLPLPSSDYLLTESTLRNCTSVTYKNAAELKKALRMVDKNNKRLKGTDSGLMSVRQTFEKVRTYWSDKVGTWLAIDFEAWEMEHSVITECGWSYIQWKNNEEVSDHGHLIVDEHKKFTNGKYVPDMRDKYNFGKSEILSKTKFKQRIFDMISGFSQFGPLYLIFHDCSQDVKYLKSTIVDAPVDGLAYFLPDATPDDGIYVVDTSDLFSALEGDIAEKRSLDKMCMLLKIPTENAHNAGNDAFYTLLALKEMASGNQLDAQRDERWPGHTEATATGSTVKVKFEPWDEDSDYSDMEGAFGRQVVDGKVVEKTMADLTMSDDDDEL